MANNQPAAKFRVGFINATVWKNNSDGGNSFYTTVLSRSYKDGDDWKQTNNLNQGDLLNGAKVLERAEDWIAQH